MTPTTRQRFSAEQLETRAKYLNSIQVDADPISQAMGAQFRDDAAMLQQAAEDARLLSDIRKWVAGCPPSEWAVIKGLRDLLHGA